MNFSQYLPPATELELLEPEIVAPLLLKCMFPDPTKPETRQMPEIYSGGQNVADYVGNDTLLRYRIGDLLNEAWASLSIEGLIIIDSSQGSGFYKLSRRGKKLLESDNFESYRLGLLLPAERLDPKLSRKVRISFLDGEYDTAVFSAYKEVETRVRDASGLPADLIGKDLMREAFKPNTGKLSDKSKVIAEQQALSDLFAGAIGFYKNPSSHREVDFSDPAEVAEVIFFANHLVRIVERLKMKG